LSFHRDDHEQMVAANQSETYKEATEASQKEPCNTNSKVLPRLRRRLPV
jgi:hypothetical protein